MAQADEVDNSYLQVIFLHSMVVLLEQLKLQLGIDHEIHLKEYALFHTHYSV